MKVAKEFNKADAARGSPARRQMIQKAQAKMLRKPKVHAEPDVREPDSDADDTSTKFKRTGSISSAGASVGGGT